MIWIGWVAGKTFSSVYYLTISNKLLILSPIPSPISNSILQTEQSIVQNNVLCDHMGNLLNTVGSSCLITTNTGLSLSITDPPFGDD
jgi:hypothetical protein